VDGRARDKALRLDAQKKTLGATERNEQARAAYRIQVASYNQDQVVVVDECGSNKYLDRFSLS
jgi:hypothetical protein